MFIITPEQDALLRVLDETRYLTAAQALRILQLVSETATPSLAAHVLNQLRYMQKVFWKSETVVTLPHLSDKPIDADMLSAVDVMLDLSDGRLLTISSKKPPFKLCFLTERGGKLGSYGVVAAPPGGERAISQTLADMEAERTVIFLLSDTARQPLFKITQQHYFAIPDNGKYRYFRGNY
jgi:hypothetical protein